MLVLKRLIVWLVEISSEALLLSLFLVFLSGPSDPAQRGFGTDLFAALAATTVVFMFSTGYLLTTATLRLVWRSERLWLYSAASAALVVAHLQVLFLIASGWSLPMRLQVQVAAACIVFACTLVGGWFLRTWVQAASDRGPLPLLE